MTNMSYCRFQNTLQDLEDCYDHLWDEDLSHVEEVARRNLIRIARSMVMDTEGEDEFFGIRKIKK